MEIPQSLVGLSPDDIKKILAKTGADISVIKLTETTLRIGNQDVRGVLKEKPDGETVFYPYNKS